MLCDSAGVRKFAVAVLRVTHRKGLDPIFPETSHDRSDGAGIESSAQKDTERHITHQVKPDCLFKQIAKLFDIFGFTERLLSRMNLEIPILLKPGHGSFVVQIHYQTVTGHESAHTLKHRFI